MYLLLELYAIVQSLSQSTTDKHLDTSKRNGSRFCGIFSIETSRASNYTKTLLVSNTEYRLLLLQYLSRQELR